MKLINLQEARYAAPHPIIEQLHKLIQKYYTSERHFEEQFFKFPHDEIIKVISSQFGKPRKYASGLRVWSLQDKFNIVLENPTVSGTTGGDWITIEDN